MALHAVQRALPPAPGHPGDLQELSAQGLLNCYEGKRNCCQGTRLHPGGTAAALGHLLTPTLSGSHPVILILQEGAQPLSSVLDSLMGADALQSGPPSSVITVLGDDAGLTPEQQAVAAAAADSAGVQLLYASLGPMQLLASQCITLVHHYLDLAVGPSNMQKPKYDPNDPWLDKIRPCDICNPPGGLGEGQKQEQD